MSSFFVRRLQLFRSDRVDRTAKTLKTSRLPFTMERITDDCNNEKMKKLCINYCLSFIKSLNNSNSMWIKRMRTLKAATTTKSFMYAANQIPEFNFHLFFSIFDFFVVVLFCVASFIFSISIIFAAGPKLVRHILFPSLRRPHFHKQVNSSEKRLFSGAFSRCF